MVRSKWKTRVPKESTRIDDCFAAKPINELICSARIVVPLIIWSDFLAVRPGVSLPSKNSESLNNGPSAILFQWAPTQNDVTGMRVKRSILFLSPSKMGVCVLGVWLLSSFWWCVSLAVLFLCWRVHEFLCNVCVEINVSRPPYYGSRVEKHHGSLVGSFVRGILRIQHNAINKIHNAMMDVHTTQVSSSRK